MSWNRVVEIAQRLCQLDISEEVTDMAQELMGIAHSNTSLEAHLGFTPPRLNEQTTASGMRPIDDDDNTPFILDAEKADLLEKPLFDDENMPKDLISDYAKTSAEDIFTEKVSPESTFDSELSAFLGEEESDKVSVVVKAPRAESLTPVVEPVSAPTAESVPVPAPAPAPVSAATPVPAEEPVITPTAEPAPVPTAESVPAPTPAPAPAPTDADASKSKGGLRAKKFATFRNLYSSRDGALCLYEDENGHLVAVDSTKLV